MIFTEKEIYKLDGKKQNLPGFDLKYHNIVDYILKITDEIWEQRAIWVIYETYEKDVVIHVGAEVIHGVDSIVSGTIKTLASFPDRKMGAEAVIWSKEGEVEFFSSHRIGSTATNLGETSYGPASNKKVFFRTIADCAIRENKIYEEWLVRDNLHLIQQLGFDPVALAKRDTRYKKGIKVKNSLNGHRGNTKRNRKLHSFDLSKPEDLIQSLFEHVWSNKDIGKLKDYYSQHAKLHAICDNNLNGLFEIQAYLDNLFQTFSNAEIEVQRITCNELELEYELAVRWKITGEHTGSGLFGPASGRKIILPGICHYIVKDGRIQEEWMVFDGYDALCQIYADIDHEFTSIQNGTVDQGLNNKQKTLAFIDELNNADQSKDELLIILRKYFSENLILNITKPFEEIVGLDDCVSLFIQPLMHAFQNIENHAYILLGGEYDSREYVSFTGNFIGTWKEDWLGIPKTNQPAWLRYSTTFLFEKGKIVKAWYFFDILGLIRQAGFNLFPNKGLELIPPIPMTGDGIVNYCVDKAEGVKTLELTNSMLDALGEYDGQSLESMGQERFWDVENMMWYGPSGIGTTRGLKGFQDHHQVPFLKGFPDRGITPKKAKDYFTQIGNGNYSCDFGFPAMYGTHNGDGWLGLKATGKNITLRVVDYWRREGDQLKENWVFIDMIDVLEQLGIDVFELLQSKIKNR